MMVHDIRVLVVDDEPLLRGAVLRTLGNFQARLSDLGEEVRFHAQSIASAQEAIAALDKRETDLLFVDHRLPDGNGLDVLRHVHLEKMETLSVMITGMASLELAIAATQAGAFDFLPKPFTTEDLRRVARKAARNILMTRKHKNFENERRKIRFQFLSVLAHELKSPIAAVESYLQILQEGTLGTDLKAYQHMIDRSLKRMEGMRRLIFDLLDLTRIESGQRNRNIETVDVAGKLGEVIEGLNAQASARNVAIRVESPATLPFQCDAAEISMVLNNLVSNAIKYNRENGEVRVKLETVGEAVRIQVADTGIGMSREETERLFGEFVRIRNEKTLKIEGSGLGLSIVRRIVNLYDGTAEVQSTPDVGTTFDLLLNPARPGVEVRPSGEPVL